MIAVTDYTGLGVDITKEGKGENGVSNTLETKFLESSICYICGEDIHNYELTDLFDGRTVKTCFECYAELKIGEAVYYCKLAGEDLQWD